MMNTSVPKANRDDAAREPAGRAGHPAGDWLDDLVATGARPRGAPTDDHNAGMRAIADQLARIEAPSRRGPGFDPAALRDAVAEITRRQAMLDEGPAIIAGPAQRDLERADAADADAEAARAEVDLGARGTLRAAAHSVETDASLVAAARDAGERLPPSAAPGGRRAGIDLSAEVSQTFARFSRDMLDAIHASDVRPEIVALDHQVRSIGRTVDGLGANLQSRPAAPVPAAEVAGTLAEMRGLLDSFRPGATIAALETRIDGLSKRLEREGVDPAALIEGLSRRVDEIHDSLQSQLEQSAVDTGPLESLVRGISDRIGQARDGTAEFEQLELAMRDVAARIDRVPAGTDLGGVQALEGQIARIGERLDRSEASLRAIDGVEHSLGELLSQLEVTRQVAIDAAETAARTAARDTLRAALQSPGLQPRGAELPSGLADKMARGIEDLRAMQEIAQRRTQDALAQIHDAMERLARHMADNDGARMPAREPRRSDTERTRAGDAARAARAPDADTPIEPGFGRTGAPREEPRFAAEPVREPVPEPEMSAPVSTEGDGPASFIAAARRAAQAAQASAASSAALKAGERRSVSPRTRGDKAGTSGGPATEGGTRVFLARRRRPLLLGLAALVMLVGALEVVSLGLGRPPEGRTGMADSVEPGHPKSRTADMAMATPDLPPAAKPVATPPAPAQPAAMSPPAPLPTLLGGATGQSPAAGVGLPGGLKSLAASGDAAAEYEVGLRYSEGRGVPRDPKGAADWLAKAAAQGLAPAEYRLGSAYEKGIGTDRDPTLAMSWYGKAAEAGNIKAMHNLAVMAAEGAAGKPDYAKAAQWFQKASAYGVRDSEFNLAILYARGLGIEQSLPKSYMWFAAAASAGDEDAAKKRDEVASKLDPAALTAAKAAADGFKPATPSPSANDVAPPPGGWEAVGAKAAVSPAEKVSRL